MAHGVSTPRAAPDTLNTQPRWELQGKQGSLWVWEQGLMLQREKLSLGFSLAVSPNFTPKCPFPSCPVRDAPLQPGNSWVKEPAPGKGAAKGPWSLNPFLARNSDENSGSRPTTCLATHSRTGYLGGAPKQVDNGHFSLHTLMYLMNLNTF